jgi:epsilon-lactone hydrolase
LTAAIAVALAMQSASVGLAQQQSGAAVTQQAPARPTYTPDGVVHVPAFELPPSQLMSLEAATALGARAGVTINPFQGSSIAEIREGMERLMQPTVDAAQQLYAVNIAPQSIAGVNTLVITPREGVANSRRVLINLHGGGFMMCARACALAESIPVAALGRFKVITVDYRQGPENVFPAASEDVAAVYRDLLRSYRPENIGIYGCSAGGALTAQSMAWFQTHGLPNPGVIGIFGAGASRNAAGDSAHVAAYIEGSFPAPRPGVDASAMVPYFRGSDLNDPLVSPAGHPQVLARFPPTLLITGTRAFDLSAAVYTHSALLKAGAESQLIVGEGMGHCYIMDTRIPEARDALHLMIEYFNDHLGRSPSRWRAR